jgi:ABC-type molybdenum transport system ATPase subunit/photorepair protein PhrA
VKRTSAELLPGIDVASRRLRSANVEHDVTAAALDGYVVTRRGLDLLRRIADTLDNPDTTRAWAVTGPYGAGKSSFAVMLTALMCNSSAASRSSRPRKGESARDTALAAVRSRDPGLADLFERRAASQPMLRAAVTARREPVTVTVRRALAVAAGQDRQLSEDLQALRSVSETDRSVLELIRRTAQRQPLLIIIDEFGKNLEYFADNYNDGDLFFLQELAEIASGRRAAPVHLLTFQHAPFSEYTAGTTSLQRREWRKIQGRFHDVSYTDDSSDVAALTNGALARSLDENAERALGQYAGTVTAQWCELGLDSLLPGTDDLFASTYPLHPVAIGSLPELCATLGQHDRTLTGFLTADEPHTLRRFLQGARGSTSAAVLATAKLDMVYDYFANSVGSSAAASGSRWIEIEARVESSLHLDDIDDTDRSLLKTVGLLNLVSSGGALRASAPVLAFALNDPQEDSAAAHASLVRRIKRLEERGYLTYRRHSDEYRLWAGTDIDISARVATLREQLSAADAADLLTRSYLPTAIVAGRHSQATGILRYFQPVVVDPAAAPVIHDEPATRPDGLILMSLGGDPPLEQLYSGPLLIGTTPDVARLGKAATEALALDELLEAPDLDVVARAEIRERLVAARAELTSVMAHSFDPSRDDVSWRLRVDSIGVDTHIGCQPSMSALVSTACDIAYPRSPKIRSEMLGRHQLTSQGAKARRELLTALLEHPTESCAGLTGHGPEVAMYRGVVEYLGLHGPVGTTGQKAQYGWKKPEGTDNGASSYGALIDQIRSQPDGIDVASIESKLSSPPYGVKAGVFPVLLTAVLATDPDIAIFEDGTFQTSLQPELLERIVKGPDRIVLKHSPIGTGQTAELLRALEKAFNIPPRRGTGGRNGGLVRVAATLLRDVAAMSEYARRTRRLSEQAAGVRASLLAARDPARLVFHDLPVALGRSPVSPESPVNRNAATRLATLLSETMEELRGLDAALTSAIVDRLGAALVPRALGIPAIRRSLRLQAGAIAIAPADPLARALLQHARQDLLDDTDWIAQAAMILESQPPAQWRDENLDRFASVAHRTVRAIGRLYALNLDAPGSDSRVQRLTLTAADGNEEHFVFDGAPDEAAEAILDQALDAARRAFGADAEHRILAALAARALRPTADLSQITS